MDRAPVPMHCAEIKPQMISGMSSRTPAPLGGMGEFAGDGEGGDSLASRIATRVEAIYASSAHEKKTIETLRASLRQRDQALADFHKQNSDLRVELSSMLLQRKKREHEAKVAVSFQSVPSSSRESPPRPPSSIRSPTELLAHTLTSVQQDLWEAKKEIEALHSDRATTTLDLRRLKEHNTTLAKAVTLAVAESEKSRSEASYLSEELKILRSVRDSVAKRNQALHASSVTFNGTSPSRALEISDLTMRSLSAVRVLAEAGEMEENRKVEELRAKLEERDEDKKVEQLKAKLEQRDEDKKVEQLKAELAGAGAGSTLAEGLKSAIAEKQKEAQREEVGS